MVTDKRIIKTERAVKTALINALSEKDINRISVSELAERASINRSTFYLHYSDVYSVIEDIENDIAKRAGAYVDKFNVNNVYGSLYVLLTNITNELCKNAAVKKFILFSDKSGQLIAKIKDILVERAMRAYAATGKEREAFAYEAAYAVGGAVDAYVKWIRSDDKRVKLETLCQAVGELTEAIINKFTS